MIKAAERNERKRLKKCKIDYAIGDIVIIKRKKKIIKKKYLEASWPFKGILKEMNKSNLKVKWISGKGEEDGKLSTWIKKHRAKKLLISDENIFINCLINKLFQFLSVFSLSIFSFGWSEPSG